MDRVSESGHNTDNEGEDNQVFGRIVFHYLHHAHFSDSFLLHLFLI
jgi:hypothetical protein